MTGIICGGGMVGMDKEEILKQVKEVLNEREGDKAGGSGHLSYVTFSDIEIEVIMEKQDTVEVTVTYTVDILSEFSIAEEPDTNKPPDPDDPYHYIKKEKIILQK